ncbi:MAG TPA: biotin/lipoyl-containing protein [Candidatus Limnocylindria bacterium]|nr:biotin/lipoyl-containing protein [Candidatus Limnocylindria bacterium]
MTSPATLDRRVRVTPAPGAGREGDEPVVVDPGEADLRIVANGRGKLILPSDDGSTAIATAVLFARSRATDPAAKPPLEVIVDGWRFAFTIEAESRAGLRERARRGAESIGHGGPTEIRAIIPGRVVGVSVADGDAVGAGQEILVIEAMKMQNELRAPRAGTVERLAVGAGSTVEVGDLLVVIR